MNNDNTRRRPVLIGKICEPRNNSLALSSKVKDTFPNVGAWDCETLHVDEKVCDKLMNYTSF